jgi:ABC-type Fe3+ transport system permease subunit
MSTVAQAGGVSRSIEPRGFRRLWRVLKQLFHELIGATFAVLALAWFNSAVRAWSRDAAHWLIALPVIVGLLFVAFAFTSFRRSRQL